MTENPYAGSPSEAPKTDEVEVLKPTPDRVSGWIPRRGHEAHGVMPTEEIQLPPSAYEPEPPETFREPLKQQDPLPVVPVWHRDVTKRVMARMRSIPITENAWARVLDDNMRRIAISFWVTPAPTATDRVYFTTDDPPPGDPSLPPYIVDGGQQIGLYQFEFTNGFFVQVVGTPPAGGYTMHVIEEYETEV